MRRSTLRLGILRMRGVRRGRRISVAMGIGTHDRCRMSSPPLTGRHDRDKVRVMPAVTDKKKLAEHMYAGDLDADVAVLLGIGKSWRYIADVVNERIDGPLTVSHELLRRWYGSTP
jgi:hypothetical protein